MRILFTRFPLKSAHGGAENQTQWLMEGLRARGHDVSFLGSCPVLLRRTSEFSILNSQFSIGPPPVTKWLALSFLWRKARMRTALIKNIQSLPDKSDVIFMLSLSEKLLLTEWAASQGIKVFWIEHDRIGPWLTRNPWLPALKKASRHATIVCVSELSRKKYIEMGFNAEGVVAIANGIPPPPSSPGPFSRGPSPPAPLPEGEGSSASRVAWVSPSPRGRRGQGMRVGEGSGMRVGTLARLSPEKGIDVLLEAIADLPEISLRIVGSGSEEGEIRRLIAEDTARLGLGISRVKLQKTVDDLASFYHSLDVFVLPSSDHDPFGLAAAEAMARGIPTIVTDACGIAGYLRDGNDALIVPAGSASALTEALKKLRNPELRQVLRTCGRRTALERFSLGRMIDQYETILQGESAVG